MLKILGKCVAAGEKETSKGKKFYWARVLVLQMDQAEIYFVKCWEKTFKVGENVDEFVGARAYIDKGGKSGLELTVRRKK